MKLEEIDLYLTDSCNLFCDFCSVKTNQFKNEIPIEKIKNIIIEAKKNGLEELHLTGGEPTLRKDLEEIVSFASLQDLNVRLITNGTLLTKKRLKRLVDCGLKSIMVSLDGMENYHNNVRGEGTYHKALKTICNAIDLKMFVRVNSVAWVDNKNEIMQLAKLINELGVDVYSIFLGSPLGYAIEHKGNVIKPLDWQKFCLSLQKLVLKENYSTKIIVEKGFLYSNEKTFDVKTLEGRGRGCYNITGYTDYILIRSNGDVYPCVFFSNEASPMGNIYDKTLEEIVLSFNNNTFYREIGKIPKECRECSNVNLCNGGCRGYAKLYAEKWYSKDPRCNKNKNKKSEIIPLCPIVKHNLNEDRLGGSSEHVLRKDSVL